jgi:hypothetical protein
MPSKKRIGSYIKDARNQAIQNALDAATHEDLLGKIAWQQRRAFFEAQEKYFLRREGAWKPPKTVFLSYSQPSGATQFTVLRDQLAGEGFNVLTGFHEHAEDSGTVLGRILAQLRESSIYLSLLTKEYEVRTQQGDKRWAPSVWTMEEKGMALALGKPFIVLVEDGIHTDFWLKTAPGKVHYSFTPENFVQRSKDVVKEVKKRYEEVVLQAQSEHLM